MRNFLLAALLVVAAVGCATQPGLGGVADNCRDCGTVRAVDLMNQGGRTTGAGAIVGAVIGGVIGHQFGSGSGQDAATAAGAVGGAVVGNEAEKRGGAGSYYRVTVDMDNGATREANVADSRGLARGSRVRLVGRNLEILER